MFKSKLSISSRMRIFLQAHPDHNIILMLYKLQKINGKLSEAQVAMADKLLSAEGY